MNEQTENWFINGIRGVNLLTFVALILGGAKLYFEVTTEIALLHRDIAEVQSDLDRIQRRLRIGAYDPGWSYGPGPTATGISD